MGRSRSAGSWTDAWCCEIGATARALRRSEWCPAASAAGGPAGAGRPVRHDRQSPSGVRRARPSPTREPGVPAGSAPRYGIWPRRPRRCILLDITLRGGRHVSCPAILHRWCLGRSGRIESALRDRPFERGRHRRDLARRTGRRRPRRRGRQARLPDLRLHLPGRAAGSAAPGHRGLQGAYDRSRHRGVARDGGTARLRSVEPGRHRTRPSAEDRRSAGALRLRGAEGHVASS